MTDERTRLTAILNAAEARVSQIKKERTNAINAARTEIELQFAPALQEASGTAAEARRALREHIDATTSHPWEGKRVVRVLTTGPSWSKRTERHEGILEVCRSGTEFSANLGYSRPNVGDVFVRKLKKDGTPGKAIHPTYWGIDEWELAKP